MNVDNKHHLFSSFCRLCEKVSKSSLKDKRSLIKKYIDLWRVSSSENGSIYPALRLLCPSLEKDRVFGLKEIRLGQEYVKILCLGKDSKDTKALTGHRENNVDFSEVVYNVILSKGSTELSTMNIEMVNNFIDEIALGFAKNDKERINTALKHLITNLSALENKWLVRILIKNTRLGLSDLSIINIFHPQAKEHYENGQDLKEICVQLNDPHSRSRKQLQVFKPFAPMLAERINSTHNVLNSVSQFVLETKFDGERMLLHKHGDQIQYFTRNGHNYSQSLSETLTPFIKSSFGSDIFECILDGEIIIFNEMSQKFTTKNESNSDVKRMKLDNLDVEHPSYIVFDVLLLNKNVLLEMPLLKRKELLRDNFQEVPKYFKIVEHRIINEKCEAIEALNIAVENREEGIMLKECTSTYKVNIRRKGGWYKLKPEYLFGLVDDIDLVIIGGYYGQGRRQGIISQFLLATLATENDTKIFYSCVRVGSGYSDNELTEILAKLEKHWMTPDVVVDSVEFAKTKPDLIIHPKNSLVLQIKGSEFTDSDEFSTGFTFRFPRVVRVRDDKEWLDCTTIEELHNLRAQGNGMLNTKRLQEDSDDESTSKKRKTGGNKTLAPHFRVTETDIVDVSCDIFGKREICVINGSEDFPKSKAEELVKMYNGSLAANPGENNYCVLANTVDDMKSRNMIQSANYDILKLTWFIKCVETRKFLLPIPSDYWFMSNTTKTRISQFFDIFGDSYVDFINSTSMKRTLNQVINFKPLTEKQLLEIENCVWNNKTHSLNFFRSMKLFVITNNHCFDPRLKINESIALFYGATLVDCFTEASHILLDFNDSDAVRLCDSMKQEHLAHDVEVIDSFWIEKYIETCYKNI
ncbi:hypothetical protein B4U80_00160 [Leptotrombidium deliense]|uniref:DNA ligase n=1 Tax=Leptotrombidium deliense TaxID=299467 RepID=A0A443SEN4_9ACAR|nr:hypothetical protein B4U80_00160 [Leptotrombidium deliense]